METTNTPEATMNRMEQMVSRTMERMTDSEIYRWHNETAPAAATFAEGVYYTNGPVCIEARDAAGNWLGAIQKAWVA
jgi:hypothetical protein